MRILELFSGTGSVSKVCKELNYEVISVDISSKYHTPTILANIMEWDYKTFPTGHFDMIWASPPCQTFSYLRHCHIGRTLKHSKEPFTMEQLINDIETKGLPILRKTQEIIEYFKPTYWFIENPVGRMQNYINNVKPYRVDYCAYADWGYKKPTHIWTNKVFIPKVCFHKKHKINIGHPAETESLTLANRYRVPPNLIKELIL